MVVLIKISKHDILHYKSNTSEGKLYFYYVLMHEKSMLDFLIYSSCLIKKRKTIKKREDEREFQNTLQTNVKFHLVFISTPGMH